MSPLFEFCFDRWDSSLSHSPPYFAERELERVNNSFNKARYTFVLPAVLPYRLPE